MSDDPKLPQKLPRQTLATLHESGAESVSLLKQALGHLTEQQFHDLVAKAGEEGLRLDVKRLEHLMDERFAQKSAEDHVDTFNMLMKEGILTRQSVVSDIKTGAGNMRIESKSGPTCFVASVVYGDPNHPDVIFLRHFRDTTLQRTRFGREFITWYWKKGPILAHYVRKTFLLKKSIRLLIGGIVRILQSVLPKNSRS